MMATSACVVFILAASFLFSGCVAFAPPETSNLGSAPSRSSLRYTDGSKVPSHPPRWSRDDPIFCLGRVCASSSSRRDTSLSMGIRSFIKRKILRKKDEGDGDGDGTDEEVSLHSILQSPGSAGLMESPRSSDSGDGGTVAGDGGNASDETFDKKSSFKAGESKRNKPVKSADDILGRDADAEKAMYEETQDRIRRMKGGGMTEEEKMAFLNNALTRTLPKHKPRGPPIRQTIPGMEDTNKKSGKEGLWDSITKKGGKKQAAPGDISVASLMMDGKMKNEEAKRRYMESITNPDRFATFSTYQQPVSKSVEEEDDDDAGVVDDYDDDDDQEAPEMEGAPDEGEDVMDVDEVRDDGANFAQMKRQIAEDRELLNPNKDNQEKSAARDAVESILSMISSNNDKKTVLSNNATAAGSPTTQTESDLGSRLEQAAEVQEKRDAEARAFAKHKREEERRAWAKAQAQRAENIHKKEAERLERAKLAAEEERRREEERAAEERAEMEARQARQDEYWAKMLEKERSRSSRSEPVEIKRKKEVIARDADERLERDVAKDAERERMREEERAREDPHEGKILEEAADARLRDRERVRDIEIQSAARASRTVATPSNDDVSVSSFVRQQQRKKEEIDRLRKLDKQSLKSLNSPLPIPGRAQAVLSPSPVPARRPSSPDLSLASLTMAKKGANPSVPEASPPPSQRLNLFEMTKFKQDSGSSSSPASSSTASRPTPAAKKRPVRQQLPLSTRSILGDGDDNEDDDLMRSGAPGLTVADALRQQRKSKGGNTPGGNEDISADDKAKKWGIDMSKFK